MVVAAFFFACMAACVKFAAVRFSALEIVFYRGVIGMALMWAVARGRGIGLGTPHAGMHAWRSAVGVVSLVGWFVAIAGLPLATAMTLNYMSGLWLAALVIAGAWWRRRGAVEPTGASHAALALVIAIGFGGVVLLLRPTLSQGQGFAAAVGLGSGLVAAVAYLQVTALARAGEPEVRTVFYFAVGSTIAGAVGMLVGGARSLATAEAWWLVPVGLFASLGQFCMTRAYSRGATLVVANLQYIGLVFGAIMGALLFAEPIDPVGWLGMAVIVGAGMAATLLRTKAVRPAPR